MARPSNSNTAAKNQPVARKTRTRNSLRQLTIADVALIASSAAAGATTAGIEAFQHSNGVVSAPTGSTSTASKQASAAKPAKKASASKTASTGNRPGRPVKADSYLQRAKTLYAKMVPDSAVADRKKVVAAFETKLGIPKKTANTYFHICHGPSKTPGKRGRKTGVANGTGVKAKASGNGHSAPASVAPSQATPDGNVNISVSASVAEGLEQAGLAHPVAVPEAAEATA